VIENAHLHVELDPATGDLISLRDKATGVDPLAGTQGQPRTAVCEDPTDTWGHRVVSYAWPGAAMTLDRIVVRETGPLRSRVRVERSWGASTLVEEYLLDHDARQVRVDVTIDWREKAHLLKLRFPVGLDDPSATYEVPYGTIERPVDGAEEPAQSWVDLTGTVQGSPAGLTVVATTKHGWDVSPAGSAGLETSSIGITAVRSPVYSWHDPRLLDPEGIYSFQDQGIQRFSLELIPHAGDWRTAQPTRRAAVLGAPVRAQQESFHPGDLPARATFADDGAGAVMITAIKGTEDPRDDGGADLIVRAVETTGRAASAHFELPFADRTIDADFRPHQVRTFRVPLDPDAEIVEVDLLEWPIGEPPA
jgi:alpha-mannosidase